MFPTQYISVESRDDIWNDLFAFRESILLKCSCLLLYGIFGEHHKISLTAMVFELETSNSVYSISRYCTFIISSLLMSSSLLMMMMMHSSFQERELYIVHSCTLVFFLNFNGFCNNR